MRVAFQNLLDDLKKGEEFLFFSVTEPERTKRLETFFKNFHTRRIKKGIPVKGIGNIDVKEKLLNSYKKQKLMELRFSEISVLTNLSISNNKVLISLWAENPIAFEITSKRLAENYRKSFYKLWETTKSHQKPYKPKQLRKKGGDR